MFRRSRHALLIILLISFCMCFQQALVLYADSDRAWIDGTCDLIERANRVVTVSDEKLLAPALQSPQVGDQKKFYAVDFSRSGRAYFTNATCRAVGEFCYIFVEDTQWQKTMTNTGAAKLRRAFDESTPANTSQGIYKLETENLASAPDEIDQDPKIYILILDIPDNENVDGYFVAGYFEPLNQKRGILRDPNTGMQFQSNEVEMIYIDANPLNTEDIIAREILAHEFQHLIHWRHDPNEDIWVNEGCSEYAALYLCGYQSGHSSPHIEAFEKEPQTSLVYWKGGTASSLANYGASYLWMMYLNEHYGGVSTISSLINQPAHGINGVNAVLVSKGYSQNFNEIFSDWKVANYLDSDSFESGRYGYANLDVKPVYSIRHSAFPVSNNLHSIQSWAANYIEFDGGNGTSDLSIDLDIKASYSFDVKIISMKNRMPVAVQSVPIESGKGQVTVPLFGYNVDTVVLIPNWIPRTEADVNDVVSYSYSANLGSKIGFRVTILPNAVNSRYVDIITSINEIVGNEVPKLTLTRLGKTVASEQKMALLSDTKKDTIYTYQVFIPVGWNGIEIKWQISYLGRSVISGDLGSVPSQVKK